MFERLVAMKRRADLSLSEFRHHWLTVHGPLMAEVPGVRYVQNHIVDATQSSNHARGKVEVDGFAQWGFVSEDAMREAGKHPSLAAAGKDLPNFVGAMTRMPCEVNSVVAAPLAGTAVKRMSLLYAKPTMTADRFRQCLVDEHAAMVAQFPGILGYRQNIVTGKLPLTDPRLAEAGVDAAGVVEMWFASADALNAGFASGQGQKTMKHGAEFLSAVTSYLVEEVQLAP